MFGIKKAKQFEVFFFFLISDISENRYMLMCFVNLQEESLWHFPNIHEHQTFYIQKYLMRFTIEYNLVNAILHQTPCLIAIQENSENSSLRNQCLRAVIRNKEEKKKKTSLTNSIETEGQTVTSGASHKPRRTKRYLKITSQISLLIKESQGPRANHPSIIFIFLSSNLD